MLFPCHFLADSAFPDDSAAAVSQIQNLPRSLQSHRNAVAARDYVTYGTRNKNGLYIFMFRQFFRNMPKELEEASYLDGCGTVRTFTKIMLPAATSTMVTVFLLSLAWQWTDTVFTPRFLDDIDIMSRNVNALMQSAGKPIEVANYVNIGAVLAVIPIALVYIVLQKFFVESIDRAGIVG